MRSRTPLHSQREDFFEPDAVYLNNSVPAYVSIHINIKTNISHNQKLSRKAHTMSDFSFSDSANRVVAVALAIALVATVVAWV